MEPNYIQLPPMPSDMPVKFVEVVWVFAQMEESERERFLDSMMEERELGTGSEGKEKLLRMMEESGGEASPYVEEFYSQMRELIGTLIAQACEMATLVFQYYCIEERSIEEISETVHVPKDIIEIMAQYYKKNEKILS